MAEKQKRFQLLQGNEACVEGAIAAGMRFYAGYPITPSTEIAERCALRLPQVGGKFMQMEDEIAGIAAALGASVAGKKAMTATSGPGFSLKQENIGYATIAEIPIVIVDVMRSGPSTGLPTSPSQGDVMQAKWGTHGDHPVIAICPASVQDTYNQTVRAFNLSERFRTPVILLMDEIVGHMREGCELIPTEELEIHNRDTHMINSQPYAFGENQYVPHATAFGEGNLYNITGLFHDETGFPTNDNQKAGEQNARIMEKIKVYKYSGILDFEEYQMEDAEIGIVCYGGTTRAVLDAVDELRDMGYAVGMFRPVTLWPFPEHELVERAKQLRRLLVVEHNYGQVLLTVEGIIKGDTSVEFVGKVNGTAISPKEIIRKVEEGEE
ncbi:2-oxoacid:acceptor oxidoreductase subunit alpha [Eubacterium sp. AB3007]|uniref:2-oxoacid:acceptor oxidoreductase subunit alpha n=1 Tax=Eubacterium sp. AB3007 TaxID=1392487 RepID=UPI000488890A|nr:2-oxoacid:acceptor oxidoreductase subunit alpha [Eubacterium sp. AB3007]